MTATGVEKRSLSAADRISLMLVILVPVGLCALYWFVGPPPTTAYVGDDFVLYDNAWRVASGQHPSSDYYSPLGFAYFGYFGFALWLGQSAVAVHYAQLVANATVVAAFWFAAKRESGTLGMAAVIVMSIFMFSQTIFNLCPTCLGLSAYYNKISTALLTLEFFLLVKRRGEPADNATAWTLGVISALLFSIKATYALPAVSLAVAYLLLQTTFTFFDRGKSEKNVALTVSITCVLHYLLTLCLIVGVLALLCRTNLIAYLYDIARAGQVRMRSDGSGSVNFLFLRFFSFHELRLIAISYYFLFVVYLLIAFIIIPVQSMPCAAFTGLLIVWAFGTSFYLNVTNAGAVDLFMIGCVIATLLALRTDGCVLEAVATAKDRMLRSMARSLAGAAAVFVLAVGLLNYVIGVAYYAYIVGSGLASRTSVALDGVHFCCM